MPRVLLALLLLATAAATAEDDVLARVTHATADGVYVAAGSENGLQTGMVGIVAREGNEIGRAEIVAVSSHSSRLRVLGSSTEPQPGDTVRFRVRKREEAPAPEVEPKRAEKPREFVPLLEKQARRTTPRARRNISHGWISVRQFAHIDNEDGLDYTRTLLGARGSVDRLAGSPWALHWNGNLSYRDGDAFAGSTLDGVRLDLYELSLARRLERGGLLRFGRFLPRALGAVGYLDGAEAEIVSSDRLSFGGTLGLKPARDDLAPSADEPTAAGWLTLASGKRGGPRYSGTFGVLGSFFDGDFDRLALLLEQHAESGSGLRFDLDAEIDADVGASLVRSGVRLTQFELRISGRPSKGWSWRIGADHHERLDNAAERSIVGSVDPTLFDDGFWRYWAGAGIELGARLSLDAEVAWIDDPDSDNSLHARATLGYREPFGATGGYLALTIYNLDGLEGDGLGGLLYAVFPLPGGRWTVSPSLGFRSIDSSGPTLDVTDVRVRVDYRVDDKWSADLGLSHSRGEGLDSTLLELGLRYRW